MCLYMHKCYAKRNTVITTIYYDTPINAIIVKILNKPTRTIYYNTNFNLFHLLIIDFYTNIDKHCLRMTHKKGSKHVGVLVF
jgi:hypothetical protein